MIEKFQERYLDIFGNNIKIMKLLACFGTNIFNDFRFRMAWKIIYSFLFQFQERVLHVAASLISGIVWKELLKISISFYILSSLEEI